MQMRSWNGGNRRRGRDWPDLVDRRDVQLGPRGRLGNQIGRIITCAARSPVSTGRSRCGPDYSLLKHTELMQHGEIVPQSQMLHDLSGAHPKQMKLALLKPFARRGYAVKCPSMGTGHGRHKDDAFVLRNHLMMIKSEVRKSLGEPATGGDQACGASEPPIRSIGIVVRFPIDEIWRNDSIRHRRVASLDYAKGFEHRLLVLLQGHGGLHLLYRLACSMRRPSVSSSAFEPQRRSIHMWMNLLYPHPMGSRQMRCVNRQGPGASNLGRDSRPEQAEVSAM